MLKFIIGCGYLGRRVVLAYQQSAAEAIGLVRTPASVTALSAQGIRAHLLDLDQTTEVGLIGSGCELFYFVPPPAVGVTDTRVQRLLAGFEAGGIQPRRVLYLSTTGVYGDCHGAWVNEAQPANPQVDRARRRWDAEQQFARWSQRTGGELVTLRVAGIYGPGKLPLARLQRGEPMVQAAEAPFTNRIHIDDLVQVCLAAMARGNSGEIYNACDGQPGTMTDYFNQVADRAGLPRPPQISLAQAQGRLSSGMLSYMGESRRLDNSRLRNELGVQLRFPDLASGLDDCFSHSTA